MRVANFKRDPLGHHSIDKQATRRMRITEKNSEAFDPTRSLADRKSQDFIGLKQRKLEPIELTSMKT